MAPECLTSDSPGNNQLLYFTSPSLLEDGRTLVMISDRTGHPNLVARDLATGREWLLTENASGWLRSYVYFDGRVEEGFGRASVSLDPARGRIYHLQGLELRRIDLSGGTRTIATLPRGQVSAFTHVSADGKRLCVPTTDDRALEGPLKDGRPAHDIDKRVQEEGLRSWLRVYDCETGALLACPEIPRAWITHVQFSPADPSLILYNHEWPGDCGIRRMWLWDGRTHLPLRTEGEGRSRRDWTCHEMWADGGASVLYHGAYADGGAAYLGRWTREKGPTEAALPASWHRYGHFTASRSGNRFVSDGYYQEADDPEARGGAWISLQEVDWGKGSVAWTPLCRHGSSWKGQDNHPHPVFDPTDRWIYFTSDAGGKRAVWRVAVP
ncbi:MAG: PD40 domain-containing protein [Spirochaetes bacterium]|nr:PD40 domain-containing protein [Spirochaetota bacterium]